MWIESYLHRAHKFHEQSIKFGEHFRRNKQKNKGKTFHKKVNTPVI